MTDEDDILAAEYALGLLSTEEASAAEARMRLDGPLSLRVAWWRDQLSPLADEAAAEPSPDLWRKIDARLGANDDRGEATRWKWATGGMGLIAACLLAIIALRPAAVPVAPPTAPVMASDPQIVASLTGAAGSAVTIAYNRETGKMLVTPVSLKPGHGDAELWIIPVGATIPVSLGVIDAHSPASHLIDPAHAKLLAPGATFAISQEVKGGSPTGKPAGPVVASGKIITV